MKKKVIVNVNSKHMFYLFALLTKRVKSSTALQHKILQLVEFLFRFFITQLFLLLCALTYCIFCFFLFAFLAKKNLDFYIEREKSLKWPPKISQLNIPLYLTRTHYT